MHKSIVTFALAFLSTGCITVNAAKLDSSKPVDIERKSLGNIYKQGGQPLELGSLNDGMEKVPAAADDARSARTLRYLGAGLATVGGVGIGWGTVAGIRGQSYGWPMAGIGLAVVAGGILSGVASDRHMGKAVETYNRSVGGQTAGDPSWIPWAAAVPEPGGRCMIAAGIASEF